MSRHEKSKQILAHRKDGVTVTIKLVCDKGIVAVEYSESLSESNQSAYQESQQSLVILIT